MSERTAPHDRRPGFPDSEDDVINNYGTYNIQPTADTDNLYPMIAQGLAAQQKKRLEDNDRFRRIQAQEREQKAKRQP